MEVTYILAGLVFAWIVEEWVWDYAITVTLVHIAMTVAGESPKQDALWVSYKLDWAVFTTVDPTS